MSVKVVSMSIILAITSAVGMASAMAAQDDSDKQPLTEKQKIQALIEHVEELEDAVFIRNGDAHSAEDAADHMRRKLRYAGSRIRTATQFIEQIASESSTTGRAYRIRFGGGRELNSGTYLKEVLAAMEREEDEQSDEEGDAEARPRAANDKVQLTMDPAQSMKHLEQFMGEWEGTLSGEQPDGSTLNIPIRWKTTKVFDGRWVRFEFMSRDEVAPGRYMEWEGLFTVNAETREVESMWMTPRLRVYAEQSRFLDGRLIFFETGSWDEAGRVLTMIALKQNEGSEHPVIEVKSTFTIAPDGESFTVVDEEKQDDGSYRTTGVFELRRVGK